MYNYVNGQRQLPLPYIWQKIKIFGNICYRLSRLTPRLHRAIADKSVVFLSKVGMEPTKNRFTTDVTYWSPILNLSKPIGKR